ncbi:hypothetical protein F5051DRAFT_422396 [Lentinula edodes]|nr:hypothetical protein F5051DRAFT_422396 [Lentinula edodes]
MNVSVPGKDHQIHGAAFSGQIAPEGTPLHSLVRIEPYTRFPDYPRPVYDGIPKLFLDLIQKVPPTASECLIPLVTSGVGSPANTTSLQTPHSSPGAGAYASWVCTCTPSARYGPGQDYPDQASTPLGPGGEPWCISSIALASSLLSSSILAAAAARFALQSICIAW